VVTDECGGIGGGGMGADVIVSVCGGPWCGLQMYVEEWASVFISAFEERKKEQQQRKYWLTQ
jgi:hypothetical protein